MGPIAHVPNCPCGPYPCTPLSMYPIAHVTHTPCTPCALLPMCPIPLYSIPSVGLIAPYPLYPIAPCVPIAYVPIPPVPLCPCGPHWPCAPHPLYPISPCAFPPFLICQKSALNGPANGQSVTYSKIQTRVCLKTRDVLSCLESKFDKKIPMGSVPNCQ